MRDDVLDGGLQEGDDVGDKFVFGLDVDEFVEMLLTDIEALFHIGALENGLGGGFLVCTEFLDQLSRSIVGVGKHYGGFTLDGGEEFGIVDSGLFQSLDEEGVFYDFELDLFAEGGTAQFASLNGVEASDVSDVNVRVGFNFFTQSINNLVFKFFSHNVLMILDESDVVRDGLEGAYVRRASFLIVTKKRLWCQL